MSKKGMKKNIKLKNETDIILAPFFEPTGQLMGHEFKLI